MARRGMQTLIRLHRWQLDELRRRLMPLEEERQSLLETGRTLLERLEAERLVVAAGQGETADLQAFKQRVMVQHAEIDQRVASLEETIERLREKMASAFQDVKKFEITEEQRQAAERKERQRREQNSLDEIGLTVHQRRMARDSSGLS